MPDRRSFSFPFPNFWLTHPEITSVLWLQMFYARSSLLLKKETPCLYLLMHDVTFATLKQRSCFAQFDTHSHLAICSIHCYFLNPWIIYKLCDYFYNSTDFKKFKCGGLATHWYTQILKDLKRICNHLPLGLIELQCVLLTVSHSCSLMKMPNSTKRVTSLYARSLNVYFYTTSLSTAQCTSTSKTWQQETCNKTYF